MSLSHLIHSLTFLRILFAPIIFIFVTVFKNFDIALFLFLIASISDYLDGYLARKFSLESDIGAILDPIADKILITFVILALSIELSSALIGFMGGIILIREFWVSALRDWNARNGNSNATKVSPLAKIKTSIQFFAFAGFFCGLFLNSKLMLFVSNLILFFAAIITIQTGLSYTIASFKK